ncbi:hypothetical protein F4678DRAFT_275820 [Xylaria arbuscula]|nr:hypothetical protein F4678DRAFT_275820 [Xylaria arbuscula]
MSPKQPKQSKPHNHPHRRSHQSKPGVSPHSRRGRSRSRPARRTRSGSVRLPSRTVPPTRVHSQSRSRPRRTVHPRDIPFYIPSSGQHGQSIPSVIADALRKQSQEHSEALTATNLANPPPTPPPDFTTQGNAMTSAPRAPGSKRRPSSSPATANARRRRRRRPRPRQSSNPSEQDDPIPPPRPQPAPFYPPRPVSPYSFFGMIRAKAEKEKRELEAKRKREKRQERRLKKKEPGWKRLDDDEKPDSPKRTKGPEIKNASSDPFLQRPSSAPPLSRIFVQEEQQYDQPHDEQFYTGSQRGNHPRQKQGKQRHKKHRREKHHRRQKRRSRYVMRDFFASLRRKLGSLFRFTTPTGGSSGQSAPPRANVGNATPTREPSGTQYARNESKVFGVQPSQKNRGRKRVDSTRQPLPYFMHGGRSPANTSWHSKLSGPGSTRRFTATVESAIPSPQRPAEEFPQFAPAVGGVYPQRYSHQSSSSAISIFARRFMGPFFSDSSDPSTLGNDLGQKRLSWRSHKLLTAGSKPVTPPSSRNPSPEDRGRSSDREQRASSNPGGYRSFSSSSMGLRNLQASSPDRRTRSTSPYRVPSPVPSPAMSPDYGLAELFATPPEVRSPVNGSPVRLSSSEYGISRLFASSPISSGSNSGSNFGLRRLFGD